MTTKKQTTTYTFAYILAGFVMAYVFFKLMQVMVTF